MNDRSSHDLRDVTGSELGILLVDDHELCRIGMRRLFERRKAWRGVGEAASPADAPGGSFSWTSSDRMPTAFITLRDQRMYSANRRGLS